MDLLCIKIEKEMKEVNSKEFSVVKIIQEPVDPHNFLSICARCHTRPLTLSLVRFILYVSATRSQDVNWNPEPFSLTFL